MPRVEEGDQPRSPRPCVSLSVGI